MINFIHSKLIFKNKVISVFIQGNHSEHNTAVCMIKVCSYLYYFKKKCLPPPHIHTLDFI